MPGPTMKHRELVVRLTELESGLSEAKICQEEVVSASKQLSPVCEYANIAVQVRGKRRYLHWRQRYYRRTYFRLEDEHGAYMLAHFADCRNRILMLEQARMVSNYRHQTAVYEHDQLIQLKTQFTVWRRLRDST